VRPKTKCHSQRAAPSWLQQMPITRIAGKNHGISFFITPYEAAQK